MISRKEITSSLVFILFGVGYLVYNTQYPLDTLNNPGPGLFPLIVGGLLTLLAIYQWIEAFQKPRGKDDHKKEKLPSIKGIFQKWKDETGPLLLMVVFAIYLFLIPWAGFFASNFLFVVISSRLLGSRDWKRPVSLAIGINLFCYLLFEIWLKLSLPRGVLV
ncbi:MAG: tripartite tricarboxylate transporter TctB family protein [Syntrophaceae bacterium]|nr:tripartite tricarboxylate transporter TctB family protein [Syntrophaceae bacterium]